MKHILILSLAFFLSTSAQGACPQGEECYFLKIFSFIHPTGFFNKGSDCAPVSNAPNWQVNLTSDQGSTTALAFSEDFANYQATRFQNQSFKLKPFRHLKASFCAKPISGPLEINVQALTLPPDCLNTENEILHKVQECQPKHQVFQAHLLPERGSLYEMNRTCRNYRERLSDYIKEFRSKVSNLDDFMAMVAITIDPVYQTMSENLKKRCDPLFNFAECAGNCLGED